MYRHFVLCTLKVSILWAAASVRAEISRGRMGGVAVETMTGNAVYFCYCVL